jgi:hypothetical protein
MKKIERKKVSGGSTLVEYSTYNPMIQDLNPSNTGREPLPT